MALFSKPKCVLWPKKETAEVYLDRRENNHFTFDVSLWQPLNDSQLQTISFYFTQNHITGISVLLPDTVAHTKSFIYDSKIDSIDKKEVLGLAESFVNFKINPDYLTYNLVQTADKTIIRSTIFEPEKFDALKANLEKLAVKVDEFVSVSAAASKVIASVYTAPTYLLYPTENHESTLSLSENGSLYLTSNYKGSNLDIQKIINYSNLYFSSPVNKIFLPQGQNIELETTKPLDKTYYDSTQIAGNLNKAGNLPLPVLGVLLAPVSSNPVIMEPSPTPISSSTNTSSMQPKKNILPFVAVFIFTAALASIIIWFLLNRNSATADLNNPATEETPAPTISQEIPTETPAPTLAEVNKSIKIQVLNATEINGQAATLKAAVTKLGFKSVAVGNATAKATENQIQLKPSLTEYGPYFQQKLAGLFDATVTTDLKETSTYDAVLIIGTKLGTPAATSTIEETPEATAAPTKKVTPTSASDL